MKITVVGSPDGDWEGVYVEGVLKFEGHSINWWQMLEALGIHYESFECDEEWITERGSLPQSLRKVKRATEAGEGL